MTTRLFAAITFVLILIGLVGCVGQYGDRAVRRHLHRGLYQVLSLSVASWSARRSV
jgi:hypothetical protein